MTRVYLSNIRPRWPIERQEEVLDRELAGWRRMSVYRDILPPRARQSHGPADLTERADMLRPTRRPNGQPVYVASLAVLAWTLPDFLAVIGAMAARGDTLIGLTEGATLAPEAGAADVAKAGEAFVTATRRTTGEGPGKGGRISGERREARAKAACEAIRERWALPLDQHPTLALLAEAGVSRATAKKHLGRRDEAQRKYQLAQAQAERNRARRKNDA